MRSAHRTPGSSGRRTRATGFRPLSLAVLGTVTALSLMAGCSSSSVLSPDRAAKEISDVLEAQAGRRPDGVTCPAEIDAEVGNEMRCELTDGDDSYGVTVTITDVTDGQAKFDIDVDPTPS